MSIKLGSVWKGWILTINLTSQQVSLSASQLLKVDWSRLRMDGRSTTNPALSLTSTYAWIREKNLSYFQRIVWTNGNCANFNIQRSTIPNELIWVNFVADLSHFLSFFDSASKFRSFLLKNIDLAVWPWLLSSHSKKRAIVLHILPTSSVLALFILSFHFHFSSCFGFLVTIQTKGGVTNWICLKNRFKAPWQPQNMHLHQPWAKQRNIR